MSGRIATREQPYLVVSDVDGTLLGDAAATERFLRWWSDWDQARKLVYVSGRHYASVVATFREAGLPVPDGVIADVGTEIRLYPSGTAMTGLANCWWPGWNLDGVRSALDSEPEFELQPSDCQSDFKRSYFVRNASEAILKRAHQRLRECGVAAEVIYSSNRDLDVLPSGASKGIAAAFLASHWAIPRSRVLTAGDSGNDLSLFYQGFRGIIVANAQPELRSLCRPDVYRAQNSYADGVVEGLNYWLNRPVT